jgi:hypothetical protein
MSSSARNRFDEREELPFDLDIQIVDPLLFVESSLNVVFVEVALVMSLCADVVLISNREGSVQS